MSEKVTLYYTYYGDDEDANDGIETSRLTTEINMQGMTWIELLDHFLNFASKIGYIIPEEQKNNTMEAIQASRFNNESNIF